MKTVKVYECDYCGKIRKTKYIMVHHEPKCFWNPESKSCITCRYLAIEDFFEGRKLTEREVRILHFQEEETYHIVGGDMEVDHAELNDEYQYLYESTSENYCEAYQCRLVKLRTNCLKHMTK